jgi:hypothetical protein
VLVWHVAAVEKLGWVFLFVAHDQRYLNMCAAGCALFDYALFAHHQQIWLAVWVCGQKSGPVGAA